MSDCVYALQAYWDRYGYEIETDNNPSTKGVVELLDDGYYLSWCYPDGAGDFDPIGDTYSEAKENLHRLANDELPMWNINHMLCANRLLAQVESLHEIADW